MRHPAPEQLINLVENKGVSQDLATVRDHLASCGECQAMVEEFKGLLGFLSSDGANEPPAELLKWGLELFQPVLRPANSSAGWILKAARLVFDSFEQPAPAGVRYAGSLPRQLLFRADEVDIDIRIESTDGLVSLSGQVLSTADRFFEHTPVRLEAHGLVRYQTQTNRIGEFAFDDVPKDTYHLSMDLPEGQVTLFCVNRPDPMQA